MPLDPSFVGRSWPPHTYEVGREKVREFALAVGGPVDGVPPTFAVVFTWEATREVVDDPALGLDFSRVVHRDQSFELQRPLVVGDVLTTVVSVSDVRELAGNDVVTFRCDVTDADGQAVLVATSTLVGRAGGDGASS